MSTTPGTFERSGRTIAVSVAGSLALLVVAWLVLPSREPAPPPAPDPEPQAALAGGVQAAPFDPARRSDDDDAEPPQVAARTLPPPTPQEREAEREAYLADPPPPIVPDPAALAAIKARDEAVPIVTAQLQDALEDREGAIRRACWKGGGESASVFVQATVAASGDVIAQTFGDDGKAPGLAECVRGQALPRKLPAPGVEVTVRAGLTFP